MRRLLRVASDGAPWPRGSPRPSTNMIEYGMMAVLAISLVSIGATLAGGELNTVFYAVADALGGAPRTPGAVTVGPGIKAVAQTPSIVTVGQRASHKGGPVKREVGGGSYLPF